MVTQLFNTNIGICHIGTANMSLYKVSISVNPAYLVDSPGFDDTTLSDTAVLREISAALVRLYKKERKLNGLIYF